MSINGEDVGEITSFHIDHEFFKAHAVAPTFKLGFDTVPDAEKHWYDHVRDAAENAEFNAAWLRDPFSWTTGWRRLAMVTAPIALVVWLGALLMLYVMAIGLDLIFRAAQWADLVVTNFDGWWDRKAPGGDTYVIDIEGDNLDEMRMTGVRKQ